MSVQVAVPTTKAEARGLLIDITRCIGCRACAAACKETHGFPGDGFEAERTFGGFTIPTRFRAGWRLGEAGEFPFFHATIEGARYR